VFFDEEKEKALVKALKVILAKHSPYVKLNRGSK
jgi:hypothetical protein